MSEEEITKEELLNEITDYLIIKAGDDPELLTNILFTVIALRNSAQGIANEEGIDDEEDLSGEIQYDYNDDFIKMLGDEFDSAFPPGPVNGSITDMEDSQSLN